MDQLLSRTTISAALAAVLAVSAGATITTWQIDPQHTAAGFAVKHLMISTVRGQFKGVTGTVNWDDQDISKSTVDITIDANTVDTSEPKRDADLKSDKFFEVAKYPTITFKSKKIEQVSAGKLKITGDLTIHGVTKPAQITAQVKVNGSQVQANGSTAFNMTDFGISPPQVPITTVDPAVTLDFQLILTKA